MIYVHYNNALLKHCLRKSFPNFDDKTLQSIGATKLLDMAAVEYFVGRLDVDAYTLAVLQSAKHDLMTHGSFQDAPGDQINADAYSVEGEQGDYRKAFEKGDFFVVADYWRQLPLAAKNILEWIQSPNTGLNNEIFIEVGERPKFSKSRPGLKHEDGSALVVSKALFDTIKYYVENGKEDPEFPYLFLSEGENKLKIWNEMPEYSLSVGRGL